MSWNWTKNSVGQPPASVSAVALTSTQRGSPSPDSSRPCVWWVRISPVSMRSNRRLRAAHSSGWMVSASVIRRSCASLRPVSSHSAALTWVKRPSVPIIAIPVGASTKASAAAVSPRSATMPQIAYGSPAWSSRGNVTASSSLTPSAAALANSRLPSRSLV